MKIKLLIALTIFIMSLIIIATVSIINTMRITSMIDALYNRPVHIFKNVLLINTGILDIHAYAKKLYSKGVKKDPEAVESMILSKDKINRSLNEVEYNIKGKRGKALAKNTKKLVNKWIDLEIELIKMTHHESPDVIHQKLNAIQAQYFLVRTKIQDIIIYALDKSLFYKFKSHAIVRNTVIITISISIMLLVLCILIAYHLYQYLLRHPTD
jgi:hypothetical protein